MGLGQPGYFRLYPSLEDSYFPGEEAFRQGCSCEPRGCGCRHRFHSSFSSRCSLSVHQLHSSFQFEALLILLGPFPHSDEKLAPPRFFGLFVPGPFLPDQIKSSVEQVSSLWLRKVSSGSTFFCSPTFSKLRPTRFFPSQEV